MKTLHDKVMDIFDERVEGFVIAIPGTLLSSRSVQRSYSSGIWELSYQDLGRTFRASGNSPERAYLNLIAARMDLEDE